MKKSKILISAVTMFSLCITPMSAYAQVDPIVQEEWTLKHGVLKTILQKPIIIIDSGVFEKHA